MSKIKKIIIIVFICILILTGILLLLISRNKNEENNGGEYSEENLNELEDGRTYESNGNGFQALEDPNVFFSVVNSLGNYLNAIYYDVNDIENNLYNIRSEEEQAEILLSLLEEEYIHKNNIKAHNVGQYVDNISYDFTIIPNDIRVRYGEDITTYLLNVYLENRNNLELEDKFYIIRVDSQNNSFSVEPILEKVGKIDDISIENTETRIDKNDYNQYQIEMISNERLVKIYMNQFMNMMLNHTELAYEKYLQEEYREARFGDVNQFKSYVEKNKEEIQSVRATQYLKESDQNGNKYVLLDQYKNTYEFYETATMSFTVRMDTYSIATDKFKKNYNTSSIKNKVMANTDKWVEMLNNRDYIHSYEQLDDTYKRNNFGSQEKFEEGMREKLPLHYKIDYNQFSEEGKTYVLEITLSDITEENDNSIQMTIFMQLGEDLDFVMSFDIKE